jgi:uncharacterized paraquat-inducible protein A
MIIMPIFIIPPRARRSSEVLALACHRCEGDVEVPASITPARCPRCGAHLQIEAEQGIDGTGQCKPYAASSAIRQRRPAR